MGCEIIQRILTKRMIADVLANIAPPTMQTSRHMKSETVAYPYLYHSLSTGSPEPSLTRVPIEKSIGIGTSIMNDMLKTTKNTSDQIFHINKNILKNMRQ